MLDTVWTSEHACAVYPGQHLFPFSLFYILLTKVMYPFIFPLQLCESDRQISVILIKSQSDDVLRFLVYFFYSPNLLHDIDAGDAYLIDISSLCFVFFSPLANYFLYCSLPLWRSQPSYCCVYLTVRFFHFPILFLVKRPSSRLASQCSAIVLLLCEENVLFSLEAFPMFNKVKSFLTVTICICV